MKKKTLDQIAIFFSNMDFAVVSAENVATYVFDNIKESRTKDWHSENIYIHKLARSSYLVLRPEADVDVPASGDFLTLFDRILRRDDIEEIEFIYDDKSSECISVYWDNQPDSNGYQTSEITTEGNLVVVIDPKNTAAHKCKENNMQPDELEKVRRKTAIGINQQQ